MAVKTKEEIIFYRHVTRNNIDLTFSVVNGELVFKCIGKHTERYMLTMPDGSDVEADPFVGEVRIPLELLGEILLVAKRVKPATPYYGNRQQRFRLISKEDGSFKMYFKDLKDLTCTLVFLTPQNANLLKAAFESLKEVYAEDLRFTFTPYMAPENSGLVVVNRKDYRCSIQVPWDGIEIVDQTYGKLKSLAECFLFFEKPIYKPFSIGHMYVFPEGNVSFGNKAVCKEKVYCPLVKREVPRLMSWLWAVM